MNKETVEIRVDEKGGFTFQAKDGFKGTSCVERTKDLELALGGHTVAQKKTKEYYEGDTASPITLNID